MQVAVLGDAGCGKTSLIRALVGLDFDDDSPPTETRTSYRSVIGGDRSDAMTFVDCGPIEDEVALRSLLRGVDCVIICYDCSIRQSFISIKSVWLDAIRAACWEQDISFIIVGCKCDFDPREVDIAEVEAFAVDQNVFFLETSARFGTNIDFLMNILRIRAPTRSSRVNGHGHAMMIPKTELSDDEFLNRAEPPTTLLIHRTGSVDLSSKASGINLHLSRDGTVVKTQPDQMLLLGNGHPYSGPIHAEEPDVEAFPLMVDVKMAGGNIGTIIVNSVQDDPLLLAEGFIRKHGLDQKRTHELARVIRSRLDEYFSPLQKKKAPVSNSTAHMLPTVAQPQPKRVPGPILARLNVGVPDGTTAVVAVREGDDVGKVIEAFRRTYDLDKDDSSLRGLMDRVKDVLRKGVVQDEPLFVSKARNDPSTSSGNLANGFHDKEPLEKMQQYMNGDDQDRLLHSNRRADRFNVPHDNADAGGLSPFAQSQKMQLAKADIIQEEEKHSSPEVLKSKKAMVPAEDAQPVPKTPTQAVPPPPPPSKYKQKPSPVPYRTPQSPSTTSVTSSPSRRPVRSTAPPSGRPAQLPSGKRVGRPLFFVDVNLGGTSERVAVHKDDNLREVAERFLEEHNISKTKTLKLTQLLEYHLRLHQKSRHRGAT